MKINNLGCYFEKGIRFNQDLRTGQKSGIPIARLNIAGSKEAPSAPQEAPIKPTTPPKKNKPPIIFLAREVFFTSSLTSLLFLSPNNQS